MSTLISVLQLEQQQSARGWFSGAVLITGNSGEPWPRHSGIIKGPLTLWLPGCAVVDCSSTGDTVCFLRKHDFIQILCMLLRRVKKTRSKFCHNSFFDFKWGLLYKYSNSWLETDVILQHNKREKEEEAQQYYNYKLKVRKEIYLEYFKK